MIAGKLVYLHASYRHNGFPVADQRLLSWRQTPLASTNVIIFPKNKRNVIEYCKARKMLYIGKGGVR